ncbi:DUF411 domain-containing protein [Allosphingosinicella sp.]|jgi:hypothetical protein|uniref:DUF411 domain-containing protein n=1 Tax=Allosphingosinicella sp. TaxID=2823234 RepID=UPI002EFC07A4
MIDRRMFVAGAGALVLAVPGAAFAQQRPRITMWKDPHCGCCSGWAERARALFGPVRTVPTADMPAFKRARGIPENLWSCHTSIVDNYLLEGHVPPADAQRLIASGNRQIRGLAVPGMPLGAPGMEAGGRTQRYQVIAFGPGARQTVFATHG